MHKRRNGAEHSSLCHRQTRQMEATTTTILNGVVDMPQFSVKSSGCLPCLPPLRQAPTVPPLHTTPSKYVMPFYTNAAKLINKIITEMLLLVLRSVKWN